MSWERVGWRHRLALHRLCACARGSRPCMRQGSSPRCRRPFRSTRGAVHAGAGAQPSRVGGGGAYPNAQHRRARWLALRPVRFPGLVAERVIAPWDLTGFGSSPAFLRRHLLGAYHPHERAIYDLALLSVLPGVLESLRDEVAEIVAGRHPRAECLADLCVFEGYRANLLVLLDQALAGDFDMHDPIPTDTTLFDFVGWMCEQPATVADLTPTTRRWLRT